MRRLASLLLPLLMVIPSALATNLPSATFDGNVAEAGGLTDVPSGTLAPSPPSTTLPASVPHDPALDFFLNPQRLSEPRHLRGFVLAQLEHQGLLPSGFLSQLTDAEGEPLLAVKFAYPLQDANGDGMEDLVINQWNLRTWESTVYVVSGANGELLWNKENLLYFPAWPPRIGGPNPQPFDNLQAGKDVNGDGAGDLLTFGFQYEYLPPPPADMCGYVLPLAGAYRMLSGRDGAVIWTEPYAGSWVHYGCEPQADLVQNLFSGILYVDSPSGPLVVYKQSTIQWIKFFDPTQLTGVWAQAVEITDYVKVLEAKTGQKKWDRYILPTENPDHAVINWITGAAELDGKEGPEILLDQLFWANPQFSEVLTRQGVEATYGRGMGMLALRGDNGENLWHTIVFEEPPVRGALPNEEAYPYLMWTRAQILEDVTGDGVPEPIALYLTADVTSAGTINGMFRTYFAPLDGKDGRKIWPENEKLGIWHKDRAYIGWGFAQALHAPGQPASFIAVGTADPPTDPPAGGRFPPKDIHLAVFKVKDGSMVWSWDRRYFQDSYVAYHMTLDQYLHGLAPYDWDGDGVRDLVTPAQYIKPAGKNQTLLANAEHRYEILSGADGHTIHAFKAWGSNGQLVSCGRYEPSFTVVTGHSRRWDVTRFDGLNGTQEWRQPVYNDIRQRPATAGVDLVLFNARCLPMKGRELINLNTWTFAIGRENGGHEINGLYGVLQASDGALAWVNPVLQGNPPIEPIIQPVELVFPESGLSLKAVGLALTPAAPSLAAGFGFTYLLHLRRKKRSGNMP